jgi:CRP-like cAMP-binding protein
MAEAVSILEALTANSREQLMRHAQPRHFTAGSALFYKGDDGSCLDLIERAWSRSA